MCAGRGLLSDRRPGGGASFYCGRDRRPSGPVLRLLTPHNYTTPHYQALRRLAKALEAEAAAVVEERADWDRIWLGRPGLLEAVEELLESGKGADIEVCYQSVQVNTCMHALQGCRSC